MGGSFSLSCLCILSPSLTVLSLVQDHLVQVKMDLSEVIRENTSKLEQLADLQQQLQGLEKDLQTSEVSVVCAGLLVILKNCSNVSLNLR